ncbi:MAG: phosphatidylserine decarboxylase [Gammaproteobacteria bacterium]|nr:phosphatidylserine decarboxylase [Gammaproteobacteria bacterium]
MIILIIQGVSLCFLIVAVVLWGLYFPHPSPLIRRRLPPRARWPEAQIRKWLRRGSFQSGFLNYFYRDPERIPPVGNSILAPADGLVTSVEVHEGIRYLVIALSFWDVHVQRSPVSGSVVKVESKGKEFMDGEGRGFAFLMEKPCPVQQRVVISTDAGEIAVRLITSLAARRIETWVREHDAIVRGQRIGRILLGSTVVLELPESVYLLVDVGERVWAGETIVAQEMNSA